MSLKWPFFSLSGTQFLLLIFAASTVLAQNPSTNDQVVDIEISIPPVVTYSSVNFAPDSLPFRLVEEMPEFPGGIDSLYRFIAGNIRYPETAREEEIEGTVYVEFIIGIDGNVRDARVIRSPDDSLSAESLRVVSLMPPWKPGRQGGKEVPVYYTLPIRFSLK